MKAQLKLYIPENIVNLNGFMYFFLNIDLGLIVLGVLGEKHMQSVFMF